MNKMANLTLQGLLAVGLSASGEPKNAQTSAPNGQCPDPKDRYVELNIPFGLTVQSRINLANDRLSKDSKSGKIYVVTAASISAVEDETNHTRTEKLEGVCLNASYDKKRRRIYSDDYLNAVIDYLRTGDYLRNFKY